MGNLLSRHVLMRSGIQPSEIDKLDFEDVIYFNVFDKEMREYETKALAQEIAKIMGKMMGG